MKKILIILGFIIFSIIIFILILELYFRIFNPQETAKNYKPAFTFPCFEKGDYYWHRLKKNTTCTIHSTVEAFNDTKVTTNSIHHRNPEVNEKDELKKRILVIGDSFTFGWGVEEKDTYPRLLENEKREVINAGLPNNGPDNYYLYLKNDGVKLNPDLVIVGFNIFNDIHNVGFDHTWEIDSNGLPTKVSSVSTYIDSQGNQKNKNLPLKFNTPIFKNSHLLAFLLDKMEKDNSGPIYQRGSYSEDEIKQKIKKIFLEMKKIAESNNSQLLIVMIPEGIQVDEETRKMQGLPTNLISRNPLQEEFKSFFEKESIDYLDLLPHFQNNTEKNTYYELDNHWNKNGHKIAADAIIWKLENQNQ